MDQHHGNPTSHSQPPGPVRKRRRLWPWILIVLVIVLAAIAYLNHRQAAADASAAGGGRRGAGGPLTVTAVTAHSGDIGVYINALGIVTPLSTVSVLSRVTGQIMKVNYTEGQMVHAGDSLI